MTCRILELKDKQVVSVKDGSVIGLLADIEIDAETGKLISIVVSSKSGFSVFSRNNETVVPWDKIEVIGNDSVLVNFEGAMQISKKSRGFKGVFFGE